MKTLNACILALSFFVSTLAQAGGIADLSKNRQSTGSTAAGAGIVKIDDYVKKLPHPKDGSSVDAYVNYFAPFVQKQAANHALKVAVGSPLRFVEEEKELPNGNTYMVRKPVNARCLNHKDAREVFKASDTVFVVECIAGMGKKPTYSLTYHIEVNSVTDCIRGYFKVDKNRNKVQAAHFEKLLRSGIACRFENPYTPPVEFGELDPETVVEYLDQPEKEALKKYLAYKPPKQKAKRSESSETEKSEKAENPFGGGLADDPK